MPSKYTIAYHEVAAPITESVTKFGGQPVWVEAPCWPLSRLYGTPMQCICQIALDPRLLGDLPTRMAYLFLTDWTNEGLFPDTFDPTGGENAVILQPGGTWSGPSLPLEEGPHLYRRVRRNGRWEQTPCEFTVALHAGDDPEVGAWDDLDPDDRPAVDAWLAALLEDKIGGTPVPNVNPPEFPDPLQWHLLLQLNTKGDASGDPFFLNLAPDGVGYAFISQDGRMGQFLWSR